MPAWIVLLAAAALAQSSARPAPPPVLEAVRIDMSAVDAQERPVDTLRPSDVEVREDGVVQAIDELRFVRIDPAVRAGERVPAIESLAEERAEASDANTRLVAIYLDDYHISAGHTDRVRAALHRFVDSLGPRDLVTVLRPLDSLLTIRLTRDRAALHRAIDGFRGRMGDYEPATAFERNYIANNQSGAETQRTQATWSTMSALAIHLANLGGGRKTLLLASEQAGPVLRRRGFEALPTSSSVIRTANRSNVSIYVLDPRDDAERTAAANEGPDLLRVLADDTDGRVVAGDLDRGLRTMMTDASTYYMLTYRARRNADGLFHAVEVTVKRPGLRVRARKGFHAPTPDELQRATMMARANEPRPVVPVEPARRMSPLIRPWFGLSRGDNGKTRVTFVWEAAGGREGVRNARTPSRIVMKADAPDGTSVFAGTILPTSAFLEAGGSGRAARAVFDAPPGRLRVQMTIEDATAQEIDKDVRDVLIRDLRAGVIIGTPEVWRARTARDVRAIETDPEAAPVAAREFSRSERLLIRVPAYSVGDAPLTVSARLLNRTRQVMRDLPLDSTDSEQHRRQIQLSLAGLAPGEYSIEITASTRSGQANETLNFRVTS